jgi:hypothetical protein
LYDKFSNHIKEHKMIRLTDIKLTNFKNVAAGKISLSNAGCNADGWGSDIVGIYGQNGSGKTSVITAFLVLKSVWRTGEAPDFCKECIAAGSNSFTIAVEGVACLDLRRRFSFAYHVEIAQLEGAVKIVAEKLAYRNMTGSKPTTKTAFEYVFAKSATVVRPKTSWDSLCAMDKNLNFDLAVSQKIASLNGYSLLFSEDFEDFLALIDKTFDAKSSHSNVSKASMKAYFDVLFPCQCLRAELQKFAAENLAVITPSRQAEPMLNVIRISKHEGLAAKDADVYFEIDLTTPVLLSGEYVKVLRTTISTISTVLGALVPGLSLDVKSLDSMMTDDGAMGERVEIVATRNDITVPLRAESEGIKKLVAILILLIDVYSKPEACVAIDELDSGIFEFLLGELLQVLQDNGRGQLIFTAHNLRPLETLDKTSLVFTTTNSHNRYVTFKGNKTTNNLRSQYLRAVNLGGQPEIIYEPTSKYEIDSAFYDASNPEE